MPYLFHALPRIGRWPRLLVAGTCLLLALASAVGGHQAVDAPAAPAQPVVVAARPLPAGHLLARADLALARWPTAVRPAGARSDPSTVAGRRLAGPGGTGEAITRTRLIGADLATGLPAGLVAAAVTLDDPHTADLVRAGDHIDVLEASRAPELAAPPSLPPDIRTVTARSLVLAVLPASTEADAELVVAVDRHAAVRIARDAAGHVFTAVVVPP